MLLVMLICLHMRTVCRLQWRCRCCRIRTVIPWTIMPMTVLARGPLTINVTSQLEARENISQLKLKVRCNRPNSASFRRHTLYTSWVKKRTFFSTPYLCRRSSKKYIWFLPKCSENPLVKYFL